MISLLRIKSKKIEMRDNDLIFTLVMCPHVIGMLAVEMMHPE